jgi:hypothetical protein
MNVESVETHKILKVAADLGFLICEGLRNPAQQVNHDRFEGVRIWLSWEKCTAFHLQPADRATFLGFRKIVEPAFTVSALSLQVVGCMESQIRYLRELYNHR